jgi:predicted Zn-dependent protease
VLKADSKNLFALNNLAWILAARSETAAEALGLVDRAIALGGINGEVLDTRARILIAAGRPERAIADLTDAIGQGGTPLQYFHLALAYSRLGKTAEAVKAFRDGQARGLGIHMIHPDDRAVFAELSSQAH